MNINIDFVYLTFSGNWTGVSVSSDQKRFKMMQNYMSGKNKRGL